MPTARLPKNGPTAAGRYRFHALVGSGASGSVYRALDPQTGQTVAVKVLHADLAGNPKLQARFAQEFTAATRLEHPNVVRALDLGTDGALSYLVTEFVDGENLGDRIARSGRLPEREAVRVVTQVAQALHYAHLRRVIHRDVKPDNILIRTDGLAKLADFGLAKDCQDDQGLTRVDMGLGTPHFMAPEQYRSAKTADPRSDLYALGATLYAALTGTIPFDECGSLTALAKKIEGDIPSPRELVRGLSRQVDEAVRRAMEPDPDRRPATCLEFFKLLVARPPAAAPAPPPPDDRRAEPRYSFVLGTSCAVDTAVQDGARVEELWPLVVRDVSAGGAGLLLARRFEPGTELTLDLGPDHRLNARVVRVHRDELGHWVHGCAFPVPLTHPQLAALLGRSADTPGPGGVGTTPPRPAGRPRRGPGG